MFEYAPEYGRMPEVTPAAVGPAPQISLPSERNIGYLRKHARVFPRRHATQEHDGNTSLGNRQASANGTKTRTGSFPIFEKRWKSRIHAVRLAGISSQTPE